MKRIMTIFSVFLLIISLSLSTSAFEQMPTMPSVQKETVLSALYESDISQIREALDLGLISCTELTQYYLDRITAYNEPYNCFITICNEALSIAEQRDADLLAGNGKGSLFGIPVVIKDNMNLYGYHTTNGRKKDDKQIADSNADVVDYLLSEGAVIIAKANMSTDAQDARRSLSEAVGETKNAYNIHLAAGGSSGGSAVSTSLNFSVAALGTDTNSSLRIPAALAGCVSLRPTFGLISVDGIKKLNSSRDVPGAITRSVYDQAIMLDALTQGRYSYAENLDKNALNGMRIGVLKQLSYAVGTDSRTEGNIDDEVATAFENALEEFRNCGAEVVTVSMPKLFSLSRKTFSNNESSHKEALYQAFKELLNKENISAVVYPTYLSTPLRSGTDAAGEYWNVYDQIYINNCRTLAPSAGIPEITVPIGNHSLGAGIGLEIAALKGDEQLLLNIAHSYTSVYDHRTAPTGAPDGYAAYHEGTLRQVIDGYLQDLDAYENWTEQVTENTVATEPDYSDNNVQIQQGKTENMQKYWLLLLLVIPVLVMSGLLRWLIKRRKRKHSEDLVEPDEITP